jgi:hypothetical protein
VADAIVGAIGSDLQAGVLRRAADGPRFLDIAVRHVDVAAPFDGLQPGLRSKGHDLCGRELPEGDRNQS